MALVPSVGRVRVGCNVRVSRSESLALSLSPLTTSKNR
jgi:hypothetical protein